MTRVLDLAAVAGVTSGDTVKLPPPSERDLPVRPLSLLHFATWRQMEAFAGGSGESPPDTAIIAAVRYALPDATDDEIGALNPLQVLLVLRVAGGAGVQAEQLVKGYLEAHAPPGGAPAATAPRRPRRRTASRAVSPSS